MQSYTPQTALFLLVILILWPVSVVTTLSVPSIFFSRPLVQSGFAWIQSFLSQASPLAPSITVRHALFGVLSDELRCIPRVFAYFLNVCKFLVWVQRNDFRFRSEPPSADCLIACLKARLRFSLPLFF